MVERIEVDARDGDVVDRESPHTPVTAPLLKINELNMSAMARVATARLVPLVRRAGTATIPPMSVVPTTPARSASTNGQSLADMSRAAIHAPTPASANWHRESCPA